MGTCKTCKYWGFDYVRYTEFDKKRQCQMMSYNGVVDIVGNLYGDSAEVHTPPTFGCNQYEAK